MADHAFCADVAAMLEDDFTRAHPLDPEAYGQQSFPFRLAAQLTRLLAPAL